MRDGWNTYYLLLLASLLSLSFPAILLVLSGWFRKSVRQRVPAPAAPVADSERRPWTEGERKTNARFFLVLNAGIGLIVLGLLLVPTVAVFRDLAVNRPADLLFRAILIIFLTGGLMIAGLLYAGRKGDLNWIRSIGRRSG